MPGLQSSRWIGWGAILGLLAGVVIGIRTHIGKRESGVGGPFPLSDSRFPLPYAASINREVRTPLAIILGYTQLLQEEARAMGADSLQGGLAKIEQAATRLVALLGQ